MPDCGRAAGDGDHSAGRQGGRAARRALEPVARLKAIAAHQGLTVFDLSDTFDAFDPADIEIAAWDDHPNAIGHRRLVPVLARARRRMTSDLSSALSWTESRSAAQARARTSADSAGDAARVIRLNILQLGRFRPQPRP